MHILRANVGSTSFKYQIIDMETIHLSRQREVWNVSAILHPPYTHTVPGKPSREGEIDAPSHIDAIAHAMQLITDPEVGCLTDLNN